MAGCTAKKNGCDSGIQNERSRIHEQELCQKRLHVKLDH